MKASCPLGAMPEGVEVVCQKFFVAHRCSTLASPIVRPPIHAKLFETTLAVFATHGEGNPVSFLLALQIVERSQSAMAPGILTSKLFFSNHSPSELIMPVIR
jgi:hypothetical protein